MATRQLNDKSQAMSSAVTFLSSCSSSIATLLSAIVRKVKGRLASILDPRVRFNWWGAFWRAKMFKPLFLKRAPRAEAKRQLWWFAKKRKENRNVRFNGVPIIGETVASLTFDLGHRPPPPPPSWPIYRVTFPFHWLIKILNFIKIIKIFEKFIQIINI